MLAAQVQGDDPKALLGTLDALKSKLGSAVIVLAQVSNGKVDLIAGVTKDVTDRVKAGDVDRDGRAARRCPRRRSARHGPRRRRR